MLALPFTAAAFCDGGAALARAWVEDQARSYPCRQDKERQLYRSWGAVRPGCLVRCGRWDILLSMLTPFCTVSGNLDFSTVNIKDHAPDFVITRLFERDLQTDLFQSLPGSLYDELACILFCFPSQKDCAACKPPKRGHALLFR